MDERHERTVLARRILDAGYGKRKVRWRAGRASTDAAGTGRSAAPVIQSQKVTYQADALFDFDKAVLKPAGKEKLDDLASKIGALNLEVVVATGYTDRIGSDKYNDRLSLRRAQAVKAYLVSKGIEANRIYTEGKGKRDPVTSTAANQKNRKQLIACLAPDRRVEVEVVGTTRQPQQ